MKKLLVIIVSKLFKPLIAYYISRPTNYRYQNIQIRVLPGVFHPRFFFSTKILLRTLQKTNLKNQTILELGAGSGLISIFAAKNGGIVTATDISVIAIENIKENQKRNAVAFPVIQSDLFQKIPPQTFDFIIINPPYYKKDPVSEADHAWYCGKNSEYFISLFKQLKAFMKPAGTVLMVLSDACDISLIKLIAAQNNFEFKTRSQHELLLEKNYVFEIFPLNLL